MLRAGPGAVKLPFGEETPLPNKKSVCLRRCSESRQTVASRYQLLARLYANSIV
jgi:hypothetical protein